MKKRLRLLSLFAALTLLFCSVFAGAASAIERVQDEGLMIGRADGFHAESTITRAEMAQIIYTMKKGTSDAGAYSKLTSSFTDINGHWAAGAVKFCAAAGIIGGKTANTFAPDDSVTGYEAAKMLLINLGYDATKEGLTGAKWSQNTKTLGDKVGLFADVAGDLDETISRGSVAQMICNALDAKIK